jgi:hypothetical protein
LVANEENMTVSITRITLRQRHARLLGKLTDDEVDALLSAASATVALWVAEAAASSGAIVSMTQTHEDELAAMQVGLLALRDRMTSMADQEEDYTEVSPVGSQQATSRKFFSRGLEKAYKVLKKERDELLRKLGVAVVTEALPAVVKTVRRAEEYTVGSYSTADPGFDWTQRDNDPGWNDR